MPADGNHKFFDITPLLPFIDDGCTLLTPNLRLARRVRAAWDLLQAERGRTSWPTLAVQSVDNWLMARWQHHVALGELPPRKVLTPSQLTELWLQEIDRSDSEGVALNLLRPAAAAALAQQARDTLVRWGLDPHLQANRQYFELEPDCGTFYRWLSAFENRLEGEELATPADCLAALNSLEPAGAQAELVLLEVDDLPPLSQALLTKLCKSLQHIDPGAESLPPRLVALPDRRTELAAMASWAASHYQEDPECTVGLVIPDMTQDRNAIEHLLRREFDCLGSNYTSLPVNFSTAITLAEAPVIRDALRMLTLASSHIALDEVVSLLQSRFLDFGPIAASSLSRLVSALFDIGQTQLETGELRFLVSSKYATGLESLADLLMDLASRRELRSKRLPSQWLQQIQDVLALGRWPGTQSLDSLEFQQVEQWLRLLEDFADFDALCEPMPLSQALSLLRRLSAERISQPKTADSNIQVLGTLEAAGLQFDQLWVCGMQASSWPAAARPNPLIPLVLQRSGDMPHSSAEREWRFSERLMTSFRRTSGQLYVSYATHVDGVPDSPSALVSSFQPVDQLPPPPMIDARWTAQHQQRDIDALDDSAAPALADDELKTLSGGSGLLENQSQCPFRAFARHRLQARPLAEPSASLSAAERGSLLHEALFVLWGNLEDSSGLAALNSETEQALCSSSASAGLEKLSTARRRQVGVACLELEERRLAVLLHEWLGVERAREDAFNVVAREQEMTVSLGRLTLQLQVDRVDALADGGVAIVDYKSSVSKVGDWLGRRPAKPQLLLYGLAAAEQPAALSFAQVRARESKFVGLGETAFAPGIATDISKAVKGKVDADDWPSLNRVWQAQLEQLADDFLAGKAAVDPLANDSCSWCGLQSLCRVGADVQSEDLQ
ncbi:MAG: PD-(D/E)XK nuclease family protein [Halieaceae bacterium]